MNCSNFIILIFTLITIEFARCENESSKFYRQDLVSLLPDVTEVLHSINDSRMISCNGVDIKWKNPWGKYVTNLSGRVHVVDSSLPNDEVHVLRLVFQQIEKKDFGNWTCEGKYGRKSFELIIYEPIEFRNYNQEIIVIANQSVTLPCAADGIPKPIIHWFHQEHSIHESIHFKKVQEGLWIDRVNRSHSGEYVCKAIQETSQFIESQDRVIQLDVQFKPEIVLTEQMKTLNGKVDDKKGKRIKYGFLNGTVELFCNAVGNPPLNISWYHKGKKISHHNIDTVNGSSLLTIHLQHNESFGLYKCVPKNILGQDEYFVYVERGIRPPKPEKCLLRGHGYESLDIDLGMIEENSEDQMRVTEYRFEMMSKDDFESNNQEWKKPNIRDVPAKMNATFIVSNLHPNTTYLIRVASLNRIGILSEWTDIEEFETLAYEPTKSANSSFMLAVSFYIFLLPLSFHFHNFVNTLMNTLII